MAELVYQTKRKEVIKSKITSIRNRCNRALDKNLNEANTRDIIQDFLVDALGWDKDNDIDSESAAVKQQGISAGYCDFIISSFGKPYIVVEAKKISKRLNSQDLAQAQYYALMKQIKWIVLTNGDRWIVYNLACIQKSRNELPEPITKKVFETSFTDINIKPADRVNKLYLLSKDAVKKDELNEYFDRHQIFNPENLIKRTLDKQVLDRIRIEIKKDTGFVVQNKEIAKKLLSTFKEEYISENVKKLIRKL